MKLSTWNCGAWSKGLCFKTAHWQIGLCELLLSSVHTDQFRGQSLKWLADMGSSADNASFSRLFDSLEIISKIFSILGNFYPLPSTL